MDSVPCVGWNAMSLTCGKGYHIRSGHLVKRSLNYHKSEKFEGQKLISEIFELIDCPVTAQQ